MTHEWSEERQRERRGAVGGGGGEDGGKRGKRPQPSTEIFHSSVAMVTASTPQQRGQ